TRRTAGKSFPLSDREQLDAVMLTEEISIDVVNFAAMKFVVAQMRTQKRLVIVAENETNLLAVDFVCHSQPYRDVDLANLRLGHSNQAHQRAAQLPLAQTKQKIRLILARIDSFTKDRAIGLMLDDSVVTGRNVITA